MKNDMKMTTKIELDYNVLKDFNLHFLYTQIIILVLSNYRV